MALIGEADHRLLPAGDICSVFARSGARRSLGFDVATMSAESAASENDVSAHRLLCFSFASCFNCRY
jgi:hypothetical protein